ncbi:unnamed protein product [Phyllotreta striolata]|uniref:Uncharacterized protein n=1 Tax=Phyllotreta striolata TaxID=444603 RepID=A0A9N9TQY4_PHYSR|nr:unnamed protein product [Phyllotreta striolata]
MGAQKYYRQVERDPENIRSIWKVLHITTFLLIILNSLISTYFFGDILKMFNYRCILHVQPIFSLTAITYSINNTQDAMLNNQSIIVDLGNFPPENNATSVYTNNGSIWYKNESVDAKISVHLKGTDYGSTTSCDLVLFVPLISLISAAAFGALIMLFGRGQQKSWIMVYPVLIASVIMSILAIIAMVSMKNGTDEFCSYFKYYTGQLKCSHYISYFTFQDKWLINEFWDNYNICYYSFFLTLLLWIIQTVVTIFRLCSLADFDSVTISVDKINNKDDDIDEKLHDVLINSGFKPLPDTSIKDESDSSLETINENTTTV